MKQTKKKPINVQLSKEDLTELLIVLKNFIFEEVQSTIREVVLAELHRQSKRLFLNSSENAKAITEIKAREEINAAALSKILYKLEFQLSCGVKTGHTLSVEHESRFRTSFRCIKCELSYGKDTCDLTEKEKQLLSITLGERK